MKVDFTSKDLKGFDERHQKLAVEIGRILEGNGFDAADMITVLVEVLHAIHRTKASSTPYFIFWNLVSNEGINLSEFNNKLHPKNQKLSG
jgi:hypothetical protein